MKYSPQTMLKFLAALLVGMFLGWLLRIFYVSFQPLPEMEVRENSSKNHLINPLLMADYYRPDPEFNSLRSVLSVAVLQAKDKGQISSASVYFRDLNSGHWTGVNEDLLYDPSSMLKVAMMMGYLKKADETDNPGLLDQPLAYIYQPDPGQYYKPATTLSNGRQPVSDLIKVMIVDSDNDALASLYHHDRQDFVEVLKNLDIAPPPATTTLDFMSPKTYSKLFRVLYGATYLSHPVSERALTLLSQTNFEAGLVAGVPSRLVVAHKFGEHTQITAAGQVDFRELHDCGIIYFPAHPYFLCVMTKGADFNQLSATISQLSRLVFQQIESHYQTQI